MVDIIEGSPIWDQFPWIFEFLIIQNLFFIGLIQNPVYQLSSFLKSHKPC